MKKLLLTLAILWMAALTVGIIFPNFYESLFERFILGSISFPSSLDNFENPTPTQSVATVVTHSTQHSNANDAIEAIEAKVGIGASTAVANSIFVGNGPGISQWSTWATTSNFQSGNIIATGSTTLQNFTALFGTTTQATTTNLAISSLSSKILYANANGSIIPLTVGSGLTESGGTLSAVATAAATFSFSTTTLQNLGTTTADFSAVIPAGITQIDFFFHASTTGPTGVNVLPSIFLNSYTGATEYNYSNVVVQQADTGGINSAASDVAQIISSGNNLKEFTIHGTITNTAGQWKFGDATLIENASIGGSNDNVNITTFSRKNTAPITSISFTTRSSATFSTTTIIHIFGK